MDTKLQYKIKNDLHHQGCGEKVHTTKYIYARKNLFCRLNKNITF